MDQDEFIAMLNSVRTGGDPQSSRTVHEYFHEKSDDENFQNFLVSFLLNENIEPNLKSLCLSIMKSSKIILNQDQIQVLLQLFQLNIDLLSYFLSRYLSSYLYDLSSLQFYASMIDECPYGSVLCISNAIRTISMIKRDSAEQMTFDDIGGEEMIMFLYNVILNIEDSKAKYLAADTIVSDIIPSIYENQEILLPGLLNAFSTLEPTQDNIKVLSKFSELVEYGFITYYAEEDPQNFYDIFSPSLFKLSENAPYSTSTENTLIENLAWIIGLALKTGEVQCDIDQVIHAFFAASIYTQDEIIDMDQNLDSFFLNEIEYDSDLTDMPGKKSIFTTFYNELFGPSILSFLQENCQSDADKRTMLYLARNTQDCSVAEDFFECYDLSSENDPYVLGNFILLLSKEDKTDESVIHFLQSENSHLILYAAKAILDLKNEYKDYLPLAFICAAPLINQIETNIEPYSHFLFSFVHNSAKLRTISSITNFIETSDLIETLLNLLNATLQYPEAFQKICLIVYRFMKVLELKSMIFENIIQFISGLVEIDEKIEDCIYFLSFILKASNRIYDSNGISQITNENILTEDEIGKIITTLCQLIEKLVVNVSESPIDINRLVLSSNFEWISNLMFIFNFMVKNEVYDPAINFFKISLTILNANIYIPMCGGILTKILAYNEDIDLFNMVLDNQNQLFIANVQRTFIYSLFALNKELCLSLMEKAKGPSFFEEFVQSCFTYFSPSIAIYDFKLFMNMMMQLPVIVNIKEVNSLREEQIRQISAQSACIRIIKNIIQNHNEHKMNLKIRDTVKLTFAFIQDDVAFSLIPFILMDIYQFISQIIHVEQIGEDPEYSEIIGEIQQLMMENISLGIM